MLQFLRNLFRSSRKPVITIGKGYVNARALHKVLVETRPDVIIIRANNYKRSVRRILDQTKN